MREFCEKHFSRQALQQRIQTLFKKKNGENDLDNEDQSTKTKSGIQSMITKIKRRLYYFFGGFRDFLFLGDGIQYAVGFILGGASLNLINHFTSGFVTPWLGVIFGQANFMHLSFTINGSEFPYGQFIDTFLTFIIITLVLYFAVVLPSKWLTEKFAKKEEATQTACLYCCSTISIKAIRCPFCTSHLEVAPEMTNSENIDINHIALDEQMMVKDTELQN